MDEHNTEIRSRGRQASARTDTHRCMLSGLDGALLSCADLAKPGGPQGCSRTLSSKTRDGQSVSAWGAFIIDGKQVVKGPTQIRQRGSKDFAMCGSCINLAKKSLQKMNKNKVEQSSVEPHHEQDAAKGECGTTPFAAVATEDSVEVCGDDLDELFGAHLLDHSLDQASSLLEQPGAGSIMPPASPTRPRRSCQSPLPKSSASKAAADKRAFEEMAMTNEELQKSNERLRKQCSAFVAERAESSRTARETDAHLYDMLVQAMTMSPSSD